MTYWDEKLLYALWAHCIACKMITKFTSFQLVYGQKIILLVKLYLPSLRIAIDHHLSNEEFL